MKATRRSSGKSSFGLLNNWPKKLIDKNLIKLSVHCRSPKVTKKSALCLLKQALIQRCVRCSGTWRMSSSKS